MDRYNMDIIIAAFMFASVLHKDQVRKCSDIPYVSHLMSVAAIVMEYGGSQDAVVAALLHDAIEDQGATYISACEENSSDKLRMAIKLHFGESVLSIVEELTETDEDPKPPWTARKVKYMGSLATASPDAVLVAAADKLHNARSTLADLRSMGPKVWDKFNSDRDSQEWWYAELVKLFSSLDGCPSGLLNDLSHVVQELFPTKEGTPGGLNKQTVYSIDGSVAPFEVYMDNATGILTLFADAPHGEFDQFRIGTPDNLANLVDLLVAVQNNENIPEKP